MLVKTSDLRMLDVVNIGDGRRLGNVYDLDLDVETGKILAIILPGEGGIFGFGRRPISKSLGTVSFASVSTSSWSTCPRSGLTQDSSTGDGLTGRPGQGGKAALIWKSVLLSTVPGVVHGVSTRLGGVSAPPFATLNLGLHTKDHPASVLENRRRFLHRLGGTLEASVWAEQVHGAEVAVVGPERAGRGARLYSDAISGVDALVTTAPGLFLAANFADCVPVMIAARER